MPKRILIIGALALISMISASLSAWFEVPRQTKIMTTQLFQRQAKCPNWVTLSQEQVVPLPQQFSLASWNIYKTQNPGWQSMLEKLSKKAEVVALQEARESTTQAYWRSRGWSATMLEAFSMGNKTVGVQLASQFPPKMVCGRRQHEPLIRLPKSLLVGVYPIADSQQELWVISLHSINFSWQIAPYLQQLADMSAVIAQHSGPVIIAGDFNTWSKRRLAVLDSWMKQHGLQAVSFKNDRRSRFFGHALDHIYYRDLAMIRSRVLATQASDHNALLATFKIIHSAG
ncbi:endonuclease/exonuclease/phosphatase family protein [Celerinatantimonas sp. YJH-8]|uniref:endonuclease/exonuclease/phosphatase family protein n=1 Tax=Celerinatantimonas sp. YJH-8 TaxID=3228714 RepID=UPI0038BE3838